jgi:hypothetical protein
LQKGDKGLIRPVNFEKKTMKAKRVPPPPSQVIKRAKKDPLVSALSICFKLP